MNSNLEGKVVLITGAGKGSGREIAMRLARAGACIAACDITPINLDETVARMRAEGAEVRAYVEDISKKMLVQGLLQQVLEDFGRLDALINCAEVEPRQRILEMDDWDWQRTLDVNLSGAFLLVQSTSRIMKEKGGGTIVLMGKRAGEAPASAAYTASKGGLEGLVLAAAEELAGAGVRLRLAYDARQAMEALGS